MLLTREVRWFFDGPLPDRVSDWFASPTENRSPKKLAAIEHRVDVYDVDAAQRGVGRKVRAGGSLDTKVRLAEKRPVELASGVDGRVEDWFKVSEPVEGDGYHAMRRTMEIVKHLATRRYVLDRRMELTTGCEVELAAVSTSGTRAWSLCFETFGPPHLREDALASAVAEFLTDSPLPEILSLDAHASFSYPEWIARVVGTPEMTSASIS